MSISITHVLTIGITTILIAMVLTSAGTMVDTETDRSAESSLETVGERLADEIGNVDQIATGTTDDVTVVAEHPQTVASTRYTVELTEDCGPLIADSTACLKLTAHDADAIAYVPVKTDAGIDESSASGGTIEISYDGAVDEISITEGRR
ncbi:DUF7266 family protein [Natrinema salifodinae]|uniref:DUF7266 family protein n=1 Tax=Natrinema salifodinae TaxID=1202768 RepID=UPI000AFAF92C|nr:hypothetical protein [Natrinema salifodinae]